MKHYNYQSDFKIVERLQDGAPFRFTYYTKEGGKSVVAEYDGHEYIGCLARDGELVVPIKGGSFNLGELKVKREYFLTDSDFADGKCDVVSNRMPTGIEIWTGPTDGQEEVEVRVAPAYQKGDKGDKGDTFTYDDLSQAQKEDLAYKVIGNAENERRAAENLRVLHEEERKRHEVLREQAESERAMTFIESQIKREADFSAAQEERDAAFALSENARQEAEVSRNEAEASRQEAERAREVAEEVREEKTKEAIESIADKVDRDDNAPMLTAGFANNLVGRGEATEEVIGFRPSGGDTSIEDGTARITRLKGETVVWNQCINTTSVNAQFDTKFYTFNVSNGLITVTKSEGGTTSNDMIFCYFSHQFIASRKYLLIYNLQRNDGQNLSNYIGGTGIYDGTKYHNILPNVSGDYKFFSPTESFTSTQMQITQNVSEGVTLSYTLRPVIYDLTKMFGAGNEPTTIEEFNARKPLNIDEYAYNEGELISTNVEAIKSVGFNAWDEEWEVGSISGHNGTEQGGTNQIRSKGYIQVIPNATYEICCASNKSQGFIVVGYDQNLNYIKYLRYSANLCSFTTQSNIKYIRFCTYAIAYGDTYNHDICIHLVHTGYRNGEYEPYKEFIRTIPIKDIKDSEGNQLFPNGLLSAGSVHDEIAATKAIKRVLSINNLDRSESISLQSVNSNGIANFAYYNSLVHSRASGTSNILKQQTTTISNTTDEGFMCSSGTLYIRIKSSTVSTVNQFKEWCATKKPSFCISLDEPIEVDLPEPLNLDYEVSDFGTEEVISSEATTPLNADIIYQFNAVDRIRDNSRHTAEAEVKLKEYETRIKSLEDIVAALTQQTSSGEAVINQGEV